MKILYIHQHFATPATGGGTRSYEFALKLIEKGHEVKMVCGETSKFDIPIVSKNIKSGIIDSIPVIQICVPYSNSNGYMKRTLSFIRFAFGSTKLAMKEDYDLIFATSTPLTVGIPGILAKIFRRKRFVFEVRDLWPELLIAVGVKNPFIIFCLKFLERTSYRFADACIGLSPGICDGIRKYTKRKKPIVMIPNGSDLELFYPIDNRTLELIDVKDTDVVCVYAGAFGFANGLDAVLKVAKCIKLIGRKDIFFLFIGNGKQKDKLIEIAKTEELDNCFFFDSVPKSKLNTIIASCDIGLMVLLNKEGYYYGTSPNKFFDYIASGLPVINNYPGWIADIITKNQLGEVVAPDNTDAFADAIIKMADNSQIRVKYGANARAFAEREFSRKDLATKFVLFLEEVRYSTL